MYNYQILTSMSKTEILEKLVKMSLETMDYDKYEVLADVMTYLFSKMDPEIQAYFFPEKEVKDVQLPEIERSKI